MIGRPTPLLPGVHVPELATATSRRFRGLLFGVNFQTFRQFNDQHRAEQARLIDELKKYGRAAVAPETVHIRPDSDPTEIALRILPPGDGTLAFQFLLNASQIMDRGHEPAAADLAAEARIPFMRVKDLAKHFEINRGKAGTPQGDNVEANFMSLMGDRAMINHRAASTLLNILANRFGRT